MKLIQLAAAALITLSSLTAQAALIDIDGGNNTNIPNANLFKFNGSIIAPQYNQGGNLKSTIDGNLIVEFTFLGKEAGWKNTFSAGMGSLDTTSAFGDSFIHTFNVGAGDLLDFAFTTNGLAAGSNTVANGSNVSFPLTQVSFTTLLLGQFNASPFDAILFFDDTGAGPDDNHDDLVIGVNVIGVPESSTIALMLIGLAGLFAARRMKA